MPLPGLEGSFSIPMNLASRTPSHAPQVPGDVKRYKPREARREKKIVLEHEPVHLRST